MSRRDLLVAMLQAFFLALFPWLRTERGVEAVGKAIESALPADAMLFKGGTFRMSIGIKGYEISENQWSVFMTKMAALPPGEKLIEIDDAVD